MSGERINQVKAWLGDFTGIAVRRREKNLLRTGIELVPCPFPEDGVATVFYKGQRVCTVHRNPKAEVFAWWYTYGDGHTLEEAALDTLVFAAIVDFHNGLFLLHEEGSPEAGE